MKDLLEYLIKNILGEKVDFEIQEEENNFGQIEYHIDIDDEYKARLIGKKGRTIKSLANLMRIIAKQENTYFNLKIKD